MDFKFLRHPCQFEYESLDNYLYRFADENAVHINWILDKFHLKSSICPDNLNKINPTIINNLSQATGLSDQAIRNMTSHGLSHSNSNDINLNYSSKFCPLCLQEHHYPRVYWQFKLLNICDKHDSILISSCPDCNAVITTSEIIKGVCRCGKDLKDIIPIYCGNQEILDFNKILYAAHNIGLNRESFFKDLTGLQYIEFVNTLLKLIQRDKDIFNLEWFINNYEYERHPDLSQYQIIYSILNDWPNRLFSIFDDIYTSKAIESLYHFNPLGDFFVYFRHEPEYDFFRKAFILYFKTRYNQSFFIKKYKGFLVKEEFLPHKSVYDLFGIYPIYFKYYHFPMEDGSFVNISEIFYFFDKIINRIDLSIDENIEYISFNELERKFWKSDSYIFTLDMLKRIKQPVKVSLFPGGGLSLFSFSKTEINELLNMTSRKLD